MTTTGTRTDPHPAARFDCGWHDGPAILMRDGDGTWHAYTLTISEAAAMIRRLAGHLEAHHRPTHDRTQESTEANEALGLHRKNVA